MSPSLSADELNGRIEEEIGRGERLGTSLSCLLVTIGNVEELAYAHGVDFPGETLTFVGDALAGELRRFDRIGRLSEHELLLLLPGADGPQGEVIARRMLGRLRSVKVESEGVRRPLRILVGLATWRRDVTAQELIEQARGALARDRVG
jgi:GGDEF domain-containing protein